MSRRRNTTKCGTAAAEPCAPTRSMRCPPAHLRTASRSMPPSIGSSSTKCSASASSTWQAGSGRSVAQRDDARLRGTQARFRTLVPAGSAAALQPKLCSWRAPWQRLFSRPSAHLGHVLHQLRPLGLHLALQLRRHRHLCGWAGGGEVGQPPVNTCHAACNSTCKRPWEALQQQRYCSSPLPANQPGSCSPPACTTAPLLTHDLLAAGALKGVRLAVDEADQALERVLGADGDLQGGAARRQGAGQPGQGRELLGGGTAAGEGHAGTRAAVAHTTPALAH